MHIKKVKTLDANILKGKNYEQEQFAKFRTETIEAQQYYETKQGGRYVDNLKNGVAREIKVGYVSSTMFINSQAAKDAELLSKNKISGVEWHFFGSIVTGKIGPSKTPNELLLSNGFSVVIHEDKMY